MEAKSPFKILRHSNPLLRKRDLSALDRVEMQHIEDAKSMLCAMYDNRGVGLSAPQVGLSYRVIVFDHNGHTPRILFNPTVVDMGKKKVSAVEGCLSFPRLKKPVKRAEKVIVSFLNENNEEIHETFTGLQARIVLHEIDHLNGILFIDHR